MTRPSAPLLAFTLLAMSLLIPNALRGQYLYLDSNGDGVRTASDVLAPAGVNTVDVWLDTDSNRDGSAAECPTQDGDLTINSYEIILRATNGTISWGAFTNRQPDFTVSFGQASSATQFYGGFGGGVILPPGLYRLATLEVTIAGGTPDLAVASSSSLSAVHLTSFGSRCSGNDFDNTLKLGTDWFEADGLPFGGIANQPPTMEPIADFDLAEGAIADRAIHATDGDGQPLTFAKVSGPFYMTVSTVDAGTGSATGNVRLAPLFTDAGTAAGTVSVGDGISSDTESFQIRVSNTSQFSVADIGTVTTGAYERTTHAIQVQAEAPPFTFEKVTGPDFMRVVTVSGANGLIVVEPGIHDAGSYAASIAVTNAGETRTKDFTIVITPPPPCGEGLCLAEQGLESFGTEIASADLNGDSSPDLIISEPTTIIAHLGRGNGWFEPGVRTPITAPMPFPDIVSAIHAADLNSDGREDLIVSEYSQITPAPMQMHVMISRGDGSFDPGPVLDSPTRGGDTALRDLNGDDHADLVAVGEDRVGVFLGLGGGAFASPLVVIIPSQLPGSRLSQVQIVDVSGDGLRDIAVLDANSQRVHVLVGRGDGTFEAPRTTASPSFTNFLSAGDLNGDGHADLGLLHGSPPPGRTSILMGGSGGSLTYTYQHRQVHGTDWGLEFADMNLDGVLDGVFSHLDSDAPITPVPTPGITVSIGRGDGTFGDQTHFPSLPAAPFGYRGICVGDWNGDGLPDIAASGGFSLRFFLNRGYTPHADRPPDVVVGNRTLTEGASGFIQVPVVDPDGDRVTRMTLDRSALPATITITETVSTFDPEMLQLLVSPGFGSAGDYILVIRAEAGGLEGTGTVHLHVNRGNRRPVADAGGPYTGAAGTPLQLNGTASQDPDGDALTYAWTFGDGTSGVGSAPQHTYSDAGVFTVSLIVQDSFQPPLSSLASTTATVVASLPGGVFLESNRTISLSGGGSSAMCIRIEPVNGSFLPADVDPTSIVMRSNGTGSVDAIAATPEKSGTVGDEDRDGIEEVGACFRRADLRQLLSSVSGRDTVEVSVEGRLASGALVRGSVDLVVVGGGGPLAAALAPNPLNPKATLSFVSPRSGAASVGLYDVGGRLVRTLLSRSDLPAGYHEITIDGLGANGARLASGVYFYRIEAGGTVANGRFSILK